MLTERSGVEMEDSFHGDLRRSYMTEEVRERYAEDSFLRVFCDQQLHVFAMKEKQQLRWHPALFKIGAVIAQILHNLQRVRGAFYPIREDLERLFTRTVDQDSVLKFTSNSLKHSSSPHLLITINVYVSLFEEVKLREDLVCSFRVLDLGTLKIAYSS